MGSSARPGASPRVRARITGLVGVVTLASGSFAGFVASKLVVRDDVVATSSNLVASESLFRFGVISNLLLMIASMFYALLLYGLLRTVNRGLARLMVALLLASVPIYMLNQVNQFAALLLARDQLYEQVSLFLELHRLGNLIAGIFFGLWLFPLGLLVFQSGFFPRILGVLLMFGSLGYLVLFVQGFLFPGAGRTLWSNPLLLVTHVSELAMLVWLLIKGLDVGKWEERAGALSGDRS